MLLRNVLIALLLSLCSASQASEIFPSGSTWKYFLGTREASNPNDAWRSIGFNDARWTNAVAPIGMGEQGIVTRLPASTFQRFWVTVFFRKTFVLTNPASVSELKLTVKIDDGCAVWINGRSAGRFNVPEGDLNIYTPFEAPLPLGDLEPTETTFTLSKDIRSLLVAGTNVVAVEAFNVDFGSSDFYFDASLDFTVDTTPPKVVELFPASGTALHDLAQVEVLFDEDVTGVDASDLLVNGVGATNLTVVSDAQYIFGFPFPANGPVELKWRSDHGIHDLAEPGNALAAGSWGYTIDPSLTPPGVVISEFMADNDKGIHDEDGDDSDWIELFNAGYVTADLAGWSLTTTTNHLAPWRFPAVSLLPQRYLVVFASGKNRTNSAAPLHTSFKLDKDGSYLALVNPEGKVVSEFAPRYPAQRTDVSYGRERGNPDNAGFFTIPTPGANNKASGPGFASEVRFSLASTTFASPFSLALSTLASNAVIRYTFGTNLPTELSPVYTNPLTITESTYIRARAFAPGLLPGPVRSESYFKLAPEVTGFSSDLPLIVLHNFGGGQPPQSADQFVAIQVFEPKRGSTTLTNRPNVAGRGVWHKRGRSTGGLSKGSFSVEFQDEDGADLDVSVGGLPSESDWVLYAPNEFDPVLIHNPVAHELARQMGEYSPRTRFVELYVQDSSANSGSIGSSEYNGVYVLEEKIKIGPNRINIDKLQPEHVQPPEVTGGYLLSIDSAPSGTRPFFAAGTSINYLEPDYAEISTPQRDAQEKYITGFFQAFGAALSSSNWTNASEGYAAYIDVPSAINHHMQGVLTFNVDALRLSGYFYKPREGKLVMGPVWDFDRTQGSADGRDFNPRLWRSTVPDYGTDMFNSDSQIFDNPWYSRMFRDIDFWQKWIDRYQELRRDVLTLTNVHAIIDRMASEVRQAQPREVERWHGAGGSDTTPRSGRQSSGGFSYTFPGTYQGEVDFMKIWYSNRLDFIDHQFVAPPAFEQAPGSLPSNGAVTLTGPAGATLYYTLDGTDPRLPGGGLSPKALTYSSPIRVSANVRIAARAQDLTHRNLVGSGNPPLNSTWSGPIEGTFVVTTPPLVITKIMFDPPSSGAGFSDGATFEYLELRNIGATPLDLAGFKFTRGVEFEFPSMTLAPGERIVVVQNLAAFHARYGMNGRVAGVYSGQLDNSGERLTLEGPLHEPILDFSYDNKWYPITKGLGFALVIANDAAPSSAWNDKTSWRVSSSLNGSPGGVDAPPTAFPAVVVNEAVSHTTPPALDSVELYNTASEQADISGWFLTDDFTTPMKYRIPNGTVLGPGAFRVFTEDEFKSGTTGFKLSAAGDQIYLFSANGTTNLTGYMHGFAFGASEEGVSFGRYITSIGEEHFVAQSSPSFGQTNSGPRVGPLVLNEIMFHPPSVPGATNNTRDEFIELHNASEQPLVLGAATAARGSWSLSGGVEFSFPTNLVIPADGYVLVVGFDPLADPGELTGFLNQYQVGTNAVILGPWSGQLQNNGERIRLFKPDPQPPTDDDAGTNAPGVLLDEVGYANGTPWPGNTSATGNSLQRIASGSYGDDPINWIGAIATPGKINAAPEADSDGDGLPDGWETAEGLNPHDATGDNGAAGDPDKDGFTNLQEYVSGTSPQSNASHLKIEAIEFGTTGLLLRFNAVAARSYSVLVRDEANAGDWSKLVDISASAASKEIEIRLDNPLADDFPKRFYRVVTPAVP